MMTALNIGKGKRYESEGMAFTGEHTIEQIAKGQRVMQALQKMYERKLIRQIKESKRTSALYASSNNIKSKLVSKNTL